MLNLATETKGFCMAATKQRTIALSGRLTPADIEDLPFHVTLDFDDVESVSYAALRALLARRKAGDDSDIVNANDDVYLAFDSTEANRFIHVSLKPHEFDLGGFHIAGDGNMGDCYFDDEGDTMVKLYSDPKTLSMARLEKTGAYTAFLSGISTPLVGEEITSRGKHGVIFERARNKKSITRLIADDPDNIEEYATTFADMFLKLHATPCAKDLTEPIEVKLRLMVDQAEFLTEQQHEYADAILDGIDPKDTCLHGDPHLGNMIIGDNGPQFIDLGSFSYGNPRFDLSMTYLECSLLCDIGEISEEMVMRNFHITPATLKRFWKLFAKHYFDAQTPAQVEEVEDMLAPLAWVMTARVLSALGADHPHFRPIFDTLSARLGV